MIAAEVQLKWRANYVVTHVQIKLIVPSDYMVTLGALILGHARQGCEDNRLARMELEPGARAN